MATCIICKEYNRKTYSVPKCENRRRRWSESCGFELPHTSKVCIKHFKMVDFIWSAGAPNAKKCRLQPGAVPSLELQQQSPSDLTGELSFQFVDVCKRNHVRSHRWNESSGINSSNSSKIGQQNFKVTDVKNLPGLPNTKICRLVPVDVIQPAPYIPLNKLTKIHAQHKRKTNEINSEGEVSLQCVDVHKQKKVCAVPKNEVLSQRDESCGIQSSNSSKNCIIPFKVTKFINVSDPSKTKICNLQLPLVPPVDLIKSAPHIPYKKELTSNHAEHKRKTNEMNSEGKVSLQCVEVHKPKKVCAVPQNEVLSQRNESCGIQSSKNCITPFKVTKFINVSDPSKTKICNLQLPAVPSFDLTLSAPHIPSKKELASNHAEHKRKTNEMNSEGKVSLQCVDVHKPKKVSAIQQNEVIPHRNESYGIQSSNSSKNCITRVKVTKFINVSDPSKTKICNLQSRALPFVDLTQSAGHIPSKKELTSFQSQHKRKKYETNVEDEVSLQFEHVRKPVVTADRCTQTDDEHLQLQYVSDNIKLKRKLKELEEEVELLKRKLTENEGVRTATNNIFTQCQLRKLRCPNKRINDISSAICLHAPTPRANGLLYNKRFSFPSASILTKWARKMKMKSGIQHFALDCMKNSFDLAEGETLCILSLEEKKIASFYEDDAFQDLGQAPKNYVQIAMVRGLKYFWKYPVFYGFDCKMSKSISDQLIKALYDSGFRVVALVSDMAHNNQTLWKELSVSIEKPWFPHPANDKMPVFIFPNAPHLLKLIGNHLNDSGVNCSAAIVSPQIITQIIQNNSISDNIIAQKLTNLICKKRS